MMASQALMARRDTLRLSADQMLKGLFGIAVVISVVLLGVTAFLPWAEVPRGYSWKFTLAAENNVAAWWAGALLAAVALFATDGHVRLRERSPTAGKGWLVIAAILLFFSFDEVGSLHERLSGWSDSLGLGSWAFLLLLGAVLGVAFLWAALRLWRLGGAERRRVLILAVGFAFLGSIAIQEYLEHNLTWEGATVRALRVGVEEGSELTGFLILFWITMENTLRSPRPPFQFLLESERSLGLAALAAAPVLLLFTLSLSDQGLLGRPVDWLSATIFLAAVAVVGRRIFIGRPSFADLILVLAGGLASAIPVAVDPRGVVEIGSLTMTMGSRALVFAALAGVISAVWIGQARRPVREALVLPGIALLFLLVPPGAVAAYSVPVLLAFTVYRGNQSAVPVSSGHLR